MLDGLNVAQTQAVTHFPDVPLQILAGPGSGKTKVLTTRIAYLIRHHYIHPTEICAVTFTNKAANEMKERLQKLIGPEDAKSLVMGTFHALCARFLRRWGKSLDLNPKFTVCDADESKKIIFRLFSPYVQYLKDNSIQLKDSTVSSMISNAKSRGVSPQDMLEQINQTNPATSNNVASEVNRIVQKIYSEYEDTLRRNNALDFDDLLIYGVRMFEKNPNLAHWCRHMLVDEFQDTNAMQYRLMVLLAKYHKCVTVVGDPDQSIYGWRAADAENIAFMRRDFPDTYQILLEHNYRSTSCILAASMAIVSQDRDRIQKTLIPTHEKGHKPSLQSFGTEHSETSYITREIKRLIAYSGGILEYKDFSILLRFNALSRLVEAALQKEGIPNKLLGGQRFFERMEIKDVVSYLQLVDNPSFEPAFIRAINTPARKIGDKSVKEITISATRRSVSAVDFVIGIHSGIYPDIKPAIRNKLKTFAPLITRLRRMVNDESEVADLIRYVVEKVQYEEHLKRTQKDWESRWENVQELINFGAQFSPADDELPGAATDNDEPDTSALGKFLQAASLSSEGEAPKQGDIPNVVTISTCHAAKGLEWPVVFIPAVEKGIFPFYRSLDVAEERRLLYVACTRAQGLLYLSHCASRMTGGENTGKDLSEFVVGAGTNGDHSRIFSNSASLLSLPDCISLAKVLRRRLPDEEDIVRSRETFDARYARLPPILPYCPPPADMPFVGFYKPQREISGQEPLGPSRQVLAPLETNKSHQATLLTPPRDPANRAYHAIPTIKPRGTRLSSVRPAFEMAGPARPGRLPEIQSDSPLVSSVGTGRTTAPPNTQPSSSLSSAPSTSVGSIKLAGGTKRLGMGRSATGYHPTKRARS